MFNLNQIKLPLTADFDHPKALVAMATGIDINDIATCVLVKQSVDARRKTAVSFVCSFRVELINEEKYKQKLQVFATSQVVTQPHAVLALTAPIAVRPVVVGAGPAGLFAALTLARAGANPIVIERGGDIISRTKEVDTFWNNGQFNPLSNVQFGEGGAGAFSDGKLTTGINDPRISAVLADLVAFGAPSEIAYLQKPHIGTDKLKGVVVALREEIKRLGGEIKYFTQLTKINTKNGALQSIKTLCNGDEQEMPCSHLCLAVGHSARDTVQMLHSSGAEIIAKAFAVGVRIEHLQRDIDTAQYGSFAGHKMLPAAEYKAAVHLPSGRSVYTFCMCPGGLVVASSSEAGGVVTNGMSFHARSSANANSAVLVGVTPADFGSAHPLAGIEFQQKIEQAAFAVGGGNYAAPAQLVGDFCCNKVSSSPSHIMPSYKPDVTWCNLSDVLPEFVTTALRQGIPALKNKLPFFADFNAVLTAPETRSSSPVRIVRSALHQSNINGLFPCGEGAGYAGGIMSSAVDGIKTAENIIALINA